MARSFTVRVLIGARDQASRTIDKVRGKFQGLSSFMSLKFAAGVGIAALAVKKLVDVVGTLTTAASVQEDAVKKLDVALRSLGPAAGAVSLALQADAAALQKVTTAGDETIIAGQALIASFTKNAEEIKAATRAALDLSAATGTDLQAAFLLMGRAAAGETSTLSRYGIILDKGIPQSEKFAAALAKINEQFGGQAQARAATFSGNLEQLGNAAGDAAEGLGAVLTQSEGVNRAINAMTDVFAALAGVLPKASKSAGELGEAEIRVAEATRRLAEAKVEVNGIVEVSRLSWVRLAVALGLPNKLTRSLRDAETELFSAVKELDEALKEEKRLLNLVADAKAAGLDLDQKLIKAARELGVITRAEVNQTLEAQRLTLIALREKKKQLGITDGQLIELERELAEETLRLNAAFAASGGSVERYDAILSKTATTQQQVAVAASAAAEAVESVGVQAAAAVIPLQALERQTVLNVAAFDRLSASQGREAAVGAAVAGGGRLILGGTRVRLAGGGSRLTSAPGLASNRRRSLF